MQIQTIKLEDIYPNERNPRKVDKHDQGIKALADSISQVGLVQPLLVVKDGGIYRIVAGERRYAAMSTIKDMDACECLVAEDMEQADEMLTLMTDNSLREDLTDVEESRGVQTMLLLGVEPVAVAKATGTDETKVRGAKIARQIVDDAAEDMTLDRLYAIAEFADDEDAVKALRDASENTWENVADNLRRTRKQQRLVEEMEKVCREGHDKYETVESFSYAGRNVLAGYITSAQELIDAIMHARIDHLGTSLTVYIVPPRNYWDNTAAYVVTSDQKEDAEVDPEKAALEQRRDKLVAAVSDGHKRREEYFAAHINDEKSLSHVREILRSEIDGKRENPLTFSLGERARAFEAVYGITLTHEVPTWLYVAMLAKNHDNDEMSSYKVGVVLAYEPGGYQPYLDDCCEYYDWCNAFELDGFETGDDELELLGLIAEIREAEEKEKEAADDDE